MARIMVYIIARMIEVDNAGTGATVDDWWVDATVGGSATVAAVKAARDAEPQNTLTSVVQYHVYYADGGHQRFTRERLFLTEEATLGPAQPALMPSPLVPTPELAPSPPY